MRGNSLEPIRVSFGRKTRAELPQPLGRAHWKKLDCRQEQHEYFLTPQFLIPFPHLERLDKEHVMKTKWWLTPRSLCAYLKPWKSTFSGAGGCKKRMRGESKARRKGRCSMWHLRMPDKREEGENTEPEKKRFAWGIFEMSWLSRTTNTILRPRHPATHAQYFLGGGKTKTRSNNTLTTSH